MGIMTTGMSTIAADGVTIIERYNDAELVAVLHASGYVALYAEDEGELVQMSKMVKSETMSPVEIANKLMGF